jgi:two-component system LytT family response regulator
MTQRSPIRTFIVDDEPLAREGIRLLLQGDPEIEVVGEAGAGREAVLQIQQLHPDLVFLDVQMPEMTGFQVLSALDPSTVPAVIFVTAYDRYALQAFEVHALDYLLKPFDDERFADAVRRAKSHLQLARAWDLRQQLLSLLADVSQPQQPQPEKPPEQPSASPSRTAPAWCSSASTRSTGSRPPTTTCRSTPAARATSTARP